MELETINSTDDADKYTLFELIKNLKTFRFPFVNTFQEHEYQELIAQAERIKVEAISYINFLKSCKEGHSA